MAPDQRDDTPSVTVDEALRSIEDGAVLVDVREIDEWQAGHAPQASHIALSVIGARIHLLDPKTPLVIVCRSGRRSRGVTVELIRDGFTAVNLTGGMQAWASAGQPVVREDGSEGAVI